MKVARFGSPNLSQNCVTVLSILSPAVRRVRKSSPRVEETTTVNLRQKGSREPRWTRRRRRNAFRWDELVENREEAVTKS